MAVVKSLKIRGIRSFGPDDSDEQGISFESPLTLILGQNGCGKTTIIEALRYAITSQMPPGMGHNDCFVHDPKVNRTTEVLAQIKLKLLNSKSRNMEVTRSMKVVLQKKKASFRTLDSLLSITDENGKTKDISKRCADLDAVLHDELGVSRAILNAVIFCHQEESGWPLDEGKKVKERFDEIFDSDKYSNCFDKLKKIRKGYAVEIDKLEDRVSHLEELKKDLENKKMDVINTETKISETEIKLCEIKKDLKPVEDKLMKIKTLESELTTYDLKLEKLKVRLEQGQLREQELKKEIKNIFEGSLPELKEKIRNYESTVKAKQKELEESCTKISYFNTEEETVANEKDAFKLKLEKFALLESQNEKKIVERNKMIVDVAKLAGVEDISTVASQKEAEVAMSAVTKTIKNLEQERSELKALADKEEIQKQQLIDESRVALSRHNQQISSKEADVVKNKREVVKLEKEIVAANESKVRLEAAEKKYKVAEEELEKAEKELNTEECQHQINEEEKVLEKHEHELDEIDKKIAKLQKQSTKLKEREVKEEMLKQKEKQFTLLKNKHRSTLTELLGNMPEKDYALSLNKLEVALNSEVNTLKQDLNDKKTSVTKLEEERKHVRSTLMERSKQQEKDEEKLYEACGTQSYENTLAKINTTVEKLQDDRNVLQSSMFVIKKYESQLKSNSCCPLCNRGFDSETEVSDLISQLNTKVMNVPSQLEKVSEQLQRESAKKEDLLSMKSLNEKIKTFKENEKPQLEKRLVDVETKINKLTEEIDGLSMSLLEPEQKLLTVKQIQGDMPLLDRYNQEVRTLTKEFETIKEQCSEVESDITLDEASTRQADLKQKISTLRAKIKEAQKKLNVHNKKVQDLSTKKNTLKEECLNLQKKVQEIYNLQETKKQLESDREKLIEEINELKVGIAPLEEALKEKVQAKAEVVKNNRASIEIKNNEIMKVSIAFDKVKSINHEIKQHIDKNIPLEKTKKEEAIKECEEKLKQIQSDRQATSKRIECLKDEISKEKIYKRELDDTVRLREVQKNIADFKKEEAVINEKLSTLNRDDLSEKDSLLVKHRKLSNEKAKTDGILDELHEILKKYKMDLKTALGKDTEKKYKEKYYELQVTKMLDKDVKDYSVALEKCLMEYHKKKMESINLIIKELWSKIYSGNDIDYIAIKAEGSMSMESERRKYEYRVVQCKNGIEIDMRGRCSAGQKVLACLIIRLALAETFSSRFGVLALDEPTTNLDQDNIKSLCMALGEIVQERMMQKNFMFIIITHDREFIESLGQIDKVTHFFEVSRNDEGKSRVKRVKFC
ncbi:DNA repair protein RAD50 [Trichoplusia ni]|uniref:DNA repair protein RAD50 n=1 Tax=Trichoplusia ni TaxID=7111 RepID=A0A7E5W0S4_TRINI|nr:DNA repair protein RAD50 [Trichoplusia ni]